MKELEICAHMPTASKTPWAQPWTGSGTYDKSNLY